jgi:hypothetical protein
MRFLILTQSNAAVADMFAAMTDEQRSAAYRVYWSIDRDLEASGELVESHAVDEGAYRSVTRRGDEVADAPLAETVEVVSGFYLVDVSGPDRAVEIAGQFPEAAVGGIRVVRTMTEEDFAAAGLLP